MVFELRQTRDICGGCFGEGWLRFLYQADQLCPWCKGSGSVPGAATCACGHEFPPATLDRIRRHAGALPGLVVARPAGVAG